MKAFKTSIFMMVVVFLFTATMAFAQNSNEDKERMNMQLFAPSIFGGDFIAFEDADTLSQLGFGFGLYYDYANSLFSYFKEDGDFEAEYDFISELHTGHFSFAFGIMDWWSIGGHIPVHYLRYREFTDGDPVTEIGDSLQESDVLIGDIMAKMKFRLLRQDLHWLGMAVTPYIIFATGDDELLIGEGRVTGGGHLSLEHDFGYFNVAFSGGYLYRDINLLLGTKIGDAITFGGGLSKTWESGVGIGVEYWGRHYAVEETDRLRRTPMEVTATLRYQFGDRGPRLVAGGGPGTSSGVGAPVYRLLGGIDYYYSRPKAGVLIIKTQDENSAALATDLVISCEGQESMTVESMGEWSSELEPGECKISATKEGYEPAVTDISVERGKDNITTLTLKAIPKPKTFLDVTVVDNCSDKGLDAKLEFADGEAETLIGGKLNKEVAPGSYKFTVNADDYEPKTITMEIKEGTTGEKKVSLIKKIKKTGKVYFASGRDVILPKSYPVLDNVADQILELCDYEMVTIEGHTDDQGNDASNMKLSSRRAKSVKAYLISKGVPGDKLAIMAFGESKPVASNVTKDGRAQNRRVEFIIK